MLIENTSSRNTGSDLDMKMVHLRGGLELRFMYKNFKRGLTKPQALGLIYLSRMQQECSFPEGRASTKAEQTLSSMHA